MVPRLPATSPQLQASPGPLCPSTTPRSLHRYELQPSCRVGRGRGQGWGGLPAHALAPGSAAAAPACLPFPRSAPDCAPALPFSLLGSCLRERDWLPGQRSRVGAAACGGLGTQDGTPCLTPGCPDTQPPRRPPVHPSPSLRAHAAAWAFPPPQPPPRCCPCVSTDASLPLPLPGLRYPVTTWSPLYISTSRFGGGFLLSRVTCFLYFVSLGEPLNSHFHWGL